MMRRLTQQQAEDLPEGTKIRVTWSGGNGPHWYFIHVDKWGNRQVCFNGYKDTLGRFISVESVAGAFIGLEKPATILEVEE
jgi:hypothetical protein